MVQQLLRGCSENTQARCHSWRHCNGSLNHKSPLHGIVQQIFWVSAESTPSIASQLEAGGPGLGTSTRRQPCKTKCSDLLGASERHKHHATAGGRGIETRCLHETPSLQGEVQRPALGASERPKHDATAGSSVLCVLDKVPVVQGKVQDPAWVPQTWRSLPGPTSGWVFQQADAAPQQPAPPWRGAHDARQSACAPP